MTASGWARKAHVMVDQHEIGGFVSEHESAALSEIALHFDIHEGTARRHLDGLVAQGLLAVQARARGAGRIYHVPGQEPRHG